MDEYLDEGEPMSESTGADNASQHNDGSREDYAEIISRDVIEYIAIADGDSFSMTVGVATKVMESDDMEVRLRIANCIFKAGIMKTICLQDVNAEFNKYLQAVQYLVPSMVISFPDFLRILCSYDFNRPLAPSTWDLIIEKVRRLMICKMLRKTRSSFNCDHWTSEDYRGMRDAVHNVYTFLIDCMMSDLADIESKDKRSQTEYEKTFLEYFSRDVFFINLLKLSDSPQVRGDPCFRTEVMEAMKQFDTERRNIEFKKSDTTLLHEWNHSIVETSVCVFVSARMNVHYEEMERDIRQAAQMVGVGTLWMWKSALRSAIELLLETPSDSPLRPFVETFFLVRLPKMIKSTDVSIKRDLLVHTARDMISALNRLPSDIWNLFQDALEKNDYPMGQRVTVARYRKAEPTYVLITHSPLAVKAARAIESVQSPEDAISVLPCLFDHSCTALNCALAHLSVEGDIHRKTAILADLNRLMEVPSEGVNGDQRWRRFDETFCALLHTYYTVNRLTVRRMVCGDGRGSENRKGVFYRWVSRFGRRDTTPNDHRDMENSLDVKRGERTEKARGFILRLNARCPLMEDDSNYSDLFDIIPYLARLLLEDAGKNTYDMSTALSTLSSSPSIVYCLLMWLYCLDHSEARANLVRSMHKVMREMRVNDQLWYFMLHSSSTLVTEMVKGARTMDCVNSSPMVAAFMIRPLRYRHELAKAEMVKKGITVASRGSCLSPWIIDLIESGNHAAQYDWVKLWVREIIKLIVMDEMTEMGELLMGAAMIDPLQTCRAICQMLGDTILDDSGETEGRPEMAPCLFVFLSRFTAQMMMMGVWAIENGEERMRQIEAEGGEEVFEAPKKKLRFEDENVEDLEDEAAMLNAHLREMDQTLTALFNRMVKACKKGFLRNSVSAVSLILKEIATGPEISSSYKLKERVPDDLLELLSFIDPLSVPFELYCAFVSDNEKRLEYLCKWKNWKGVEYPEMEKDDEETKAEEDRRAARVL